MIDDDKKRERMKEIRGLKKMRLFHALSLSELITVAKVLHSRKFKAGQAVISEGAPGGSIYLVQKGELKVSRMVRGKARELGTFRSGDHFGEMSFIDKKPRSAGIYATQNSELLVITRKAFEKLLHDSPLLQIKLMQALLEDLCDKLRERHDSLDFDFSDLLPVTVFETDKRGNILFINRSGLDAFGYTERDFDKGLNALNVLLFDGRRKNLQSFLKGGKSCVSERTALRKDGSRFPVIVHSELILKARKTAGLRMTLVDITQRKKMEEELRRANEELEESVRKRTEELQESEEQLQKAREMEVMGRLVSGVAHEVRTPLFVISTSAETLCKKLGDLPEATAILSQVERLSNLTKDLLEFGRPVWVLQKQPHSVHHLLEDAVGNLEASLPQARGKIKISIPDSIQVLGDRDKLIEVFLNLLENAAQHSPEASPVIRLTAKVSSSGVSVRIRDGGSGIPPEQLGKIFEPFFSLRKGGVGLGLSIARRLAEMHGGEIRVFNNDPAPGCTFEVHLPHFRTESL